MKFYDALQLSTATIKEKWKAASTPLEKRYFLKVLVCKDILVVAFAILFICGFNLVFGTENSSAAVIIFCLLLAIRFVDFGYRIQDTYWTLGFCFLILTFSPLLVQGQNLLFNLFVHLVSLLLLLVIACDQPFMGNAGLYVFGYVFLVGSPVKGQDVFARIAAMAAGYALCALVLFLRHRQKAYEKGFLDVLKGFSLLEEKCLWQLRMALGVSTVLFFGQLFHLPRLMWAGIACMSVMSPFQNQIHKRAFARISGAIGGSLLFCLIFPLIPLHLRPLFGPAAGLLLGLSAAYHWNCVFNCFGALLAASSLYGIQHAAFYRIADNLFGCLYGVLFYWCFQQAFKVLFNRKKAPSQLDG